MSVRDAAGLRLSTLDASYRIGRAGRFAMARSLRMPPTHVLPKGPRRDFVEELFEQYRAAKRPTLREISERIRGDDELAGTASRETIRRMLLGEVVPAQWQTVNAVFLTLCMLAGRDPESPRYPEDRYGDEWSCAQAMEKAWHAAIDDLPPDSYRPLADDEPPF